MEYVIMDCDNTLGLPDRDIDDGLTVLYLLGAKKMTLMGLTLTYGNAELKEVVQSTQEFIDIFNLTVPVYSGARNSQNRSSSASQFLAEMVAKHPHEITIIATGALTNLAGAAEDNPHFFKQVKRIILMGGILTPLEVNGQGVKELNFSCDPEATKTVLLSEAPLVIMNGHLTAQAYFPRTSIAALTMTDSASSDWLNQVMHNWCDWNITHLAMDGFCNWDMTTAIYLTNPELFSSESVWLSPQQELTKGKMTCSLPHQLGKEVIMPKKIFDVQKFNECMITTIGRQLR